MLLDKLWVRLKGELLTLKEDLSEGDAIREKALSLLERMESLLKTPERDSAGDQPVDREKTGFERNDLSRPAEEAAARTTAPRTEDDGRSLADLQREAEELLDSRRKEDARSSAESSPAPNPRKLG